MYSSCLYCHAGLGKNESVEHFPVGRRLAFDAANGRFWVICPACKRWNLSPLEERWDAIDECERLFEGTRRRLSTDNIGLARIADGTELVRVGEAKRPEMAAWRFGAQLAARRRSYMLLVGGGALATAGLYVGIKTAGGGFIFGNWAWKAVKGGYERVTRLCLPNPRPEEHSPLDALVAGEGAAAAAARRELQHLRLARVPVQQTVRVETSHARDAFMLVDRDDERVHVNIAVVGGSKVAYAGAGALSVAPKILAKINRSGGKKADERLAVAMLEGVAGDRAPDLFTGVLRRYAGGSTLRPMKDLPPPVTLALEMALQEQRERELLAGELLDLEFAWREAEELARITDSLGSTAIDRALARLKSTITG